MVEKLGGWLKYLESENIKKQMELEYNKSTINIKKFIGRDSYENISAKSAKNLNINSNNPTINKQIEQKNNISSNKDK
jgi:hypothetical protein